MLFLDARSAFDTVVIEFLVRNLYLMGMNGNSIIYLKNRLANRITYCNWENRIMGPIFDEHGLEQGGCPSSDLYKIYNNDLLKILQKSNQGVDLGNFLRISGVGQADDIGILSNDIYALLNLLHLTLNYCKQFHIELCADKTKLLLLTNNSKFKFVPYNPIKINDQEIPFSDRAEHVGVVRSPEGNIPHILDRILAHKKKLGALLFTGIARSHRGNLAASVKIEKLYGMPVLFSGVASLVLLKSEIQIIDQHYKNTLSSLLKLHHGTPQSFIYFMSGSLPGKAILHQRQLSLFSMICQLPLDPLNARARHVLTTSSPTSRSWFSQIREICLLYGFPHPLQLLEKPLSKIAFKKLARSHIVDFWEKKLREECSPLTSLSYFKPAYHSLLHPHPMLLTAGPNPYEVAKSVVQCRMLSGRYRTELLSRHWSNNKHGFCLSTTCSAIPESLEHILLFCPAYTITRTKITRLWLSTEDSNIAKLVTSVLNGSADSLMQFLLDASTHPTVISLTQLYGPNILQKVFHLTRSWCFAVHKERAKILGRWATR